MRTPKVLSALAAAAWLTQVQAQAIYKCVGADGKTTYSHSRCANAKQIRGGSAAPGAAAQAYNGADVSKLPNLPAGKWAWKNIEGDTCGDPLENFRKEISAAYTNAAAMGCKAQLSAPGPGNTVFILDCPNDATYGGVNVRKGKLEISVYSPSPETVRVSTKAPGGPTELFEATRLGDC